MADLILPNSRFEMPSLYYPRRKPVGKVDIDYSKGNIARWDDIYIEGLVNDKEITKPKRIKGLARGWDFTGAYEALSNKTFETTVTDFTAMLVFNPDALTANDMILQTGASSAHFANFAIWLDSSGFYTGNTSLFSLQLSTIRAETSTNSMKIGELNCAVFSWVGGTGGGLTVCVNGRVETATLSGTNPSFIPSSTTLRLGGYAGTLNDFNGVLYAACLKRGATPEAQCRSLSNDTYQFLIPA